MFNKEIEIHTVSYSSEIKMYGIKLHYGIYLTGFLPFNNHNDYMIEEYDLNLKKKTGHRLVEVVRSKAPLPYQFRVDYDHSKYYSTSIIEFNGIDNGKTLMVTYIGTAPVVSEHRVF